MWLALLIVGCLGPDEVAGTVFLGPFDGTVTLQTELYDDRVDSLDALGRYRFDAPRDLVLTLRAEGQYVSMVSGEPFNSVMGFCLAGVVKADYDAVKGHLSPVTHLVADRAGLLAETMPLAEAIAQAETEVVRELGLGRPDFALSKTATDIDPFGGDSDDAAYVFAVSAILTATGHLELPSYPEAGTEQVLVALADDLADGDLAEALRMRLQAGEAALDVAEAREHVDGWFADLGVEAEVPGFSRMIDGDDDGLYADIDPDDQRLVTR